MQQVMPKILQEHVTFNRAQKRLLDYNSKCLDKNVLPNTTLLLFQDHPLSHCWDFILKEVMFGRRIPFTQIAFVSLLGVGGGIYIYRPYFEHELKTPGQQNQDVPKKQNETNNTSQ